MARKSGNSETRTSNAGKNRVSSARSSESKVINISDELGVEPGEETLAQIRDRLDAVDALAWDRCIEALGTHKAMGKWPDFMRMMAELKKRADLNSSATIDVVFDEVAIASA